ncbi:hypothetical protein HQ545_03855 [Candidatus Woesearchaeota archaeon]|nr:hypothetical protein [Candidatus Woesearchaeota archaeon]
MLEWIFNKLDRDGPDQLEPDQISKLKELNIEGLELESNHCHTHKDEMSPKIMYAYLECVLIGTAYGSGFKVSPHIEKKDPGFLDVVHRIEDCYKTY